MGLLEGNLWVESLLNALSMLTKSELHLFSFLGRASNALSSQLFMVVSTVATPLAHLAADNANTWLVQDLVNSIQRAFAPSRSPFYPLFVHVHLIAQEGCQLHLTE